MAIRKISLPSSEELLQENNKYKEVELAKKLGKKFSSNIKEELELKIQIVEQEQKEEEIANFINLLIQGGFDDEVENLNNMQTSEEKIQYIQELLAKGDKYGNLKGKRKKISFDALDNPESPTITRINF